MKLNGLLIRAGLPLAMRMRRIYAYLWRGSLTRAGEPRRDRVELVVVFPFLNQVPNGFRRHHLSSLSLRLTSFSLIFLCACSTDPREKLSPADGAITDDGTHKPAACWRRFDRQTIRSRKSSGGFFSNLRDQQLCSCFIFFKQQSCRSLGFFFR